MLHCRLCLRLTKITFHQEIYEHFDAYDSFLILSKLALSQWYTKLRLHFTVGL